jgi:TATA-box binding protein (TBP) (component of TFIID and TFIIIB)
MTSILKSTNKLVCKSIKTCEPINSIKPVKIPVQPMKPVVEPPFTKSNLRISTMVITAHWGVPIQLDNLFELLKAVIIPIWLPMEGILKFEHKNMVIGSSHKDIFTNRKITSKSFFNQSTIVLRRKINGGEETEGKVNWKEVNVKLFANGGIQMTGVVSESFAYDAIQWLLKTLLVLPESPFIIPTVLPLDAAVAVAVAAVPSIASASVPVPAINRFSVQLINTDYTLNKFINQDALHKILINEYNLFSMLEKTIYQGVNTKFFYNTSSTGKGICECENFCKGQGIGAGNGECKRITMSIFRTGRIIITGARKIEQIETAYRFLNTVFERYHKEVLYQPNSI